MAKPMLVTFPFLLLLLDWVMFKRLDRKQLVEKLPFMAFTAVSCVVTYWVQLHGGAVRSDAVLTLPVRLGNAIVSYGAYLGQTAWPAKLAAFYPHAGVGLLPLLASLGALTVISAVAVALARTTPEVLMDGSGSSALSCLCSESFKWVCRPMRIATRTCRISDS